MMKPARDDDGAMRTTLTLEDLDDEVAALLKERMLATGHSFEEVVNIYLRLGLDTAIGSRPIEPFMVAARNLGSESIDLDCIAEVLDRFEGSRHR